MTVAIPPGVRTPPVAPGRLPVLGHLGALARDPLGYMARLRSVGDVVAIHLGPRVAYLVTSHDLVRDMMTSQSESFTRGALFERAGKALGQGLLVSDGELHRRQRRLLQPAFHRQQIARYTAVMAESAQTLSRAWRPGGSIEVAHEIHTMALAVVCRGLFQTDVGQSAVSRVEQALIAINQGVIWQTFYPFEWLAQLPIPVNRRFQRAIADVRELVAELVAAYRCSGQGGQSALAMLLEARDEDTGQPMSDCQVRDEVLTLLLAATETSSTTLSWLFYELDRHPEIEREVVRELDDKLGAEPITYDNLRDLELLKRVVHEALRLHTPNSILTRRTVEEVRLGQFQIPAGVEVAFSPTAIHRDPTVYDDPLAFKPDRWAAEHSAPVPRHTFIPFGIGKHKCIGDAFAMTEMLVTAATILRDWHLSLEPKVRVRERPWAIVQPQGLRMTPFRRQEVLPHEQRGANKNPALSSLRSSRIVAGLRLRRCDDEQR
ncbi:cytochrome P450 [Mycobacterium vicinigordonae]|uniref:Cytochrome P450 n=1 Tax=Mycobacterium vicinigordonae TaxID=1719132 RepID=A0A7D6HNR6_9MYCO|nr:cytochrome P450 [Mycobacterium vicinigordonae]QLL06591.1 cytochrome P450 [Mycobacterium vicinigordonae]